MLPTIKYLNHNTACGFCDMLVDFRCISGTMDVQSS